jgi:hypothetical protein
MKLGTINGVPITETLAKALITDFKNYSSDFKYALESNDLTRGIQTWYENLSTLGDTGLKIYDAGDIQTLATLFGTSEEKIRDAIKALEKDAT